MPTLEFWFEFASSYSYLAAERLTPLAEAAGVTTRWRAFLLGPVFREQGWNDSPFNLYPVKGRYMWRDLERLCDRYGLPFRRPSQFPRNGLLAARVATFAADEPWLPAFVRAVYRANFAEDRDIAAPQTLAPILEGLGQAPQPVLEAAGAPQNKQTLRARGEEVKARGIFGAPAFWANGELFWGQDRLEQALEWARAAGPGTAPLR